jgi:Ca2+-transporting ATPase
VSGGRSDNEVRAVAFAAIVFGNLALILAHRSRERTIVHTLSRPNRALWWVVGGALAALGAAIYVPAAAQVFRFAPLGVLELSVALAAALLGVVWLEAAKLARRQGAPGL